MSNWRTKKNNQEWWRKEPKSTICTCTCLCIDAILACRLCLIHIKLLLSESAVSCLLRVRSVFLEEVICYFIYAKFAVMLRLSINTVVVNHVNSDHVPIFLLNVGTVPTVWYIFLHFSIHFRLWKKPAELQLLK
jgi:hypothetical protein